MITGELLDAKYQNSSEKMLTEAKGCNLVKFCRPSSAAPARERPQECGRSGAGAV